MQSVFVRTDRYLNITTRISSPPPPPVLGSAATLPHTQTLPTPPGALNSEMPRRRILSFPVLVRCADGQPGMTEKRTFMKNILITGASRGIGRAAAMLCGAVRGVAINYLQDELRPKRLFES